MAWYKFLKIFDLRGGIIMGLFSLEMLAIIPFYVITRQQLPTTIRDIYIAVLSAFATHSIAKVVKGDKDDAQS